MKPGLTIIDALRDRRLFGALPEFHDLTTWARWLVFLKAVFGLPLDEAELEIFRHHTGRQKPRVGGYPESVAVVGVQSGKSFTAAMIAALAAAMTTGLRDVWAVLVSQDARAALRTLFRYVSRPFEEVPALKRMVVGTTADTIQLRNGVTIAAYPCRPAAVRGLRAVIAVCDEFAFFIATDGRPVDLEMLRALRGRLATTAGKLLILSSPYTQSGALYDLHRKHFGREDSDILVWVGSAPEMNPTLPADYLERMRQDDPEAYRSEVLGEFRAGVTTFIDPELLAECVAEGRREIPPSDDIEYHAFADAASGSGKDSFAVAIGHKDGERIVVDVVRRWQPSFNPGGVITEVCDLAKRYRCFTITADRYAPGFVAEHVAANQLTLEFAELNSSRLYLELLPHVNAGAVELPDDPNLLRELRGLERRRGTAGLDKVTHRPGAHDDLAVVCAGVVATIADATSSSGGPNYDILNGEPDEPSRPLPAALQRYLANRL